MRYKNLSKEEKLDLCSCLFWDYQVETNDILDVIEGRQEESGILNQEEIFARCLMSLSWNNIVNLWTIEKSNQLYSEKVRRKLYPATMRRKYDIIFGLLRNRTLPRAEQDPEYFEEMRRAILFNRRNRLKQGISEPQVF